MANTAPTLDTSASPALATALEGATNPSGTTISSLLTGGADANGNTLGMAVTALDTSLGAWQYSTDGGTTWLTIHADLINNTTDELALLLGATDKIRLLPFGDLNGSLATAVTFRAWDGTSGTHGDYTVIAATGGTTALSTASDTASINVTAVNDAPTFAPIGGTGKEVITVGSVYDFAQAVTVQPDGKILLAGFTYNGSNNDFVLVRLNADGSLDTSFNSTGKELVSVGTGLDDGYSVTVQPDGKILVAGYGYNGSNDDFGLVRLNADGSLDTSFNSTGKELVPVGSADDEGYSVTVQPDGKIVVAGVSSNGSNNDFGVVRMNADGSLDTSFNTTGKELVPVGSADDYGRSVTVQPDGKILVAGYSFNGSNYDFGLVRLNADGSLDTGFNSTGKELAPVGSSHDLAYSVTVQPDGKILVAGDTTNGTNVDFGLVRLNADGSLDTSFNGTGKESLPVGSSTDVAQSVTIQSDGKILVAGYVHNGSNYDFGLVRLNADGSLDTSFNGTGKELVPVGSANDDGYSVTVQPDGKILVAGSSYVGSNSHIGVIRLNADGSLDTTFNGTSTNTLGGTIAYTENAAAVALDSSVSIYDADLATSSLYYGGASVTLARHGGTSSDDVFSARGNLAFTSGYAVLSSDIIGTVTNSGGTLTISFNDHATQTKINEALSSIGYANASDNPSASVQIDWTFSDGNSSAQGSGGALTATGSTTVNITAVNDPAVISGTVTGNTTEKSGVANGTAGTASASATLTDTDADNTANTFTASSGSTTHGSYTMTAGGTWTFTLDDTNATVDALNAGSTLTDTFGITTVDGTSQTITVTIHGANDAAVIGGTVVGDVTEDALYVSGNPTATGTLTDTDVDNTANTFQAVTSAQAGDNGYGTYTVTSGGAWTYTIDNASATVNALNPSETVTDTFSVLAQDGTPQTVTITIHGANDWPDAVADTASVTEAGTAPGTGASGNLLANDSDPDNGDSLTMNGVAIVTSGGPAPLLQDTPTASTYGTITINSDGTYAYAVDNTNAAVDALRLNSDTLTDKFMYQVSDSGGNDSVTTLTVTIHGANDAPVGVADAGSATESGAAPGSDATGNVLTNDTDVDSGDTKVVSAIVGGAVGAAEAGTYGSLTLNADGTYTYVVDDANSTVQALRTNSDTLTDNFTYIVSDTAGATSAATLSVTIHGANDAPVGVNDTGSATATGASPGSNATGNVLTNDTDVDSGDTKTVTALSGGTLGVAETGSYGSLTLNADGTYTYVIDGANATVNALSASGTLTDTFTYTMSDTAGATGTATLAVTIHGANHAPVGVNDLGSATEAGISAGSNATGNVLTNDTDADSGDTKAVSAITGGTVGVAETGSYGSLTLNADGTYTYVIDDANNAVQALRATTDPLFDTFTYTVSDTAGASSTATLTVAIHGANDAPVAVADTGSATEAGTGAGSNATGNVLTNDTDVDSGDTKAVTALAGGTLGVAETGSHGSLTLNANGTYTYVVDDASASVDALNPSQTLTDTFTYTMRDAAGATSTATLTVTIHGANDAPTGSVTISGTADAGQTLTANASLADPEGLGTFSYQWKAGGVNVGTNSSSYVLSSADLGKTITATVSYVDGGGTTESVTGSIATSHPGLTLTGTTRADHLIGSNWDDVIDGGSGRDTMEGGLGNDTYYVNAARDVVTEASGAGHDTVYTTGGYALPDNVEDLDMLGSTRGTLKGNALDNMIVGNSAANVIYGYAGSDQLTGAGGADTFVFTSTADSTALAWDTVTDFNVLQGDKINLHLIDAQEGPAGDQAFTFIGTAQFSDYASAIGLLRFDPGTHMLEGSTNADANAEFRVLLVGVDHIGTDAGGISAASFVL